MTDTTPLETKGAGGETARAFEEFLEAFDAFKETNDQRLAEIERRGTADALTAEKLARIEETLDSTKRLADGLALKSARPHLGPGAADPLRNLRTRRRSTATSAAAMRRVSRASKRKHCQPARAPTAAISCRPKRKRRSTAR